MPVVTENITIGRTRELQMFDITQQVTDAISRSGLGSGIATIFTTSSTSAITTIEFEPGLKQDFPAMLERLAPLDLEYQHDLTWHDGNGHSHNRASLLGPGLTVPFVEGRPTLGTWQQIMFIEFDNKPRDRRLVVQMIGE